MLFPGLLFEVAHIPQSFFKLRFFIGQVERLDLTHAFQEGLNSRWRRRPIGFGDPHESGSESATLVGNTSMRHGVDIHEIHRGHRGTVGNFRHLTEDCVSCQCFDREAFFFPAMRAKTC